MGYRTAIAILILLNQSAASDPPEYLAFRLDRERAVAVLKVLSNAPPYRGPDATERVDARYGFPPLELPDVWKKWIPSGPRSGDRWRLHAAPGLAVDVVAEGLVGGQPQCEGMIGAVLRVSPESVDDYNATKARYFIARQIETDSPHADAAAIGVSSVAIDAAGRAAIERLLAGVLAREHQKVLAKSPQRARTTRWSELDDALRRGTAKLTFDLQTFRLRADEPPVHFIRAEWLVGSRQAFAAGVWIRSGERPEVVEADTRPASWLRMGEFNGRVERAHMGLVLDVLDRDGDGWGEILLVQEGYEGFSIKLLEYSPSGFSPQAMRYGTGC